MSWWVARPGRAEGPFNADELREQARVGALLRDDLVASTDGMRWQRAARAVPDAFPQASWAGPIAAVLLFALLLAGALAIYLSNDRWSTTLSAPLLMAAWLSVIPVAVGTAWAIARLMRGAAAASGGWRALRAWMVPIVLGASLLIIARLKSVHDAAVLSDEIYRFTLVERSSEVIRFEGEIGRRFAHDLRAAKTGATRVIEIADSKGGSLDAALDAAEFIQWNQLSVRVLGRCQSACVALFAASPKRQVSPLAEIGLHRSSSILEGEAPGTVDADYADVLRQARFSEAILQKRLETPAEQMLTLLPTRDMSALPSIEFVHPDTYEPIDAGQANLHYVANMFAKETTEVSQVVGETLGLVIRAAPDLASTHGAELGAAFHSNDGNQFGLGMARLVQTTFQRSLREAGPDSVRDYWALERSMSEPAFVSGDYATCGAPSMDQPNDVAKIARAKNRVITSALEGPKQSAPAFSDADVTRFQALLWQQIPSREIPSTEFDPITPRAKCALGVAVARVMVNASDADLPLFNAINVAE